MQLLKSYIAELLLHRSFHFKCDCLMNMDVRGEVVDYSIIKDSGEILFIIKVIGSDNKLIKIGSNHPNLQIEEI